MAESTAPQRITKSTLIDEAISRYSGKPFNRTLCEDLMSWLPARIGYHLSKGADVNWSGLGTFGRKIRAAGAYRNPSTGESVKVPRRRVARFRPALPLRAAAAFPAQAKAMTTKSAAPAPSSSSPKPEEQKSASAPSSRSRRAAPPPVAPPPAAETVNRRGRPRKEKVPEEMSPPPPKAAAKERRAAKSA